MLARMNHIAARASVCVHDAETPTGDPTGTGKLRRVFVANYETRWRKLARMVRDVVLAQDLLGIASTSKPTSLTLALAGMGADARIKAFQAWLDDALTDVVLEGEGEWITSRVRRAYNMGVSRAMRLAKSSQQPLDAGGSIGALGQLAYIEQQGINEAVSQSLVRIAASGIIDKLLPRDIYDFMVDRIEKVGISRSNALVEAITNKAFNTGTLDQLEAAGIRSVGIVPEIVRKPRVDAAFFDAKKKKPKRTRGRVRVRATGPGSRIPRGQTPSRSTIYRIRKAQEKLERLGTVNILTAGDERVCDVCEGIAASGPYSINEARGRIPAHPRCRCAFTPADDARFAANSDIDEDDDE